MKLYFSPGACSLSPHIALREAGLEFELERVDMASKKTATGDDYYAINPTGFVPALRLQGGEVLTEGPAIVQWIADQVPDRNLAPPPGGLPRYRLQETLNYISTDLHKGFSPLFHKECPESWKQSVRATLGRHFDLLTRRLTDHPYITGGTYTVADGYLYTILSWTRYVKLDLTPWPTLVTYHARIEERPAVHAALVAEGLRRHNST